MIAPLQPRLSNDTEWVCPIEYPDLSQYEEIAIDLETRDPNLKELGSGWARGDGYIIGIAVAVANGQWYFPIRHGNGGNLDPRLTLQWLADVCSNPGTDYIFHNSLYDVGWLQHSGIQIKGRIIDTIVAAPLIDENRFSYSLNSLLRDYLGERKDERELNEAAKQFGLNPKSDMWKMPAQFVGAYAEQDAAGTFRLWQHFKQLIIKEEVNDIFDLETALLPTVIEMRRRGVRVDTDRIEQVKKEINSQEKQILDAVAKEYGIAVDIWAAASVAKVFDKAGIEYKRTEKTNAPSFTKEFLKNHPHPLARQIVAARELNKVNNTFLDAFLVHQVKGRIHAEAHPLRSDDGGTVTGRFSYSNPNLQQIPNPKKNVTGKIIRSLFLPEDGCRWGSFDYASQEPRLVVHYANLLDLYGAKEFAAMYQEDVKADFHRIAANIIGSPPLSEDPAKARDDVKIINLGLFYGMGKKKLAASLGLPYEQAEELFAHYHDKVPFVRALSDYTMNRASKKGVIRTLLGRRCRFEKWEPAQYGVHSPLSYDKAYAEHGPAIKRAFTYKALNRLIQGSAADQTKKAMLHIATQHALVPLIQVHDELTFSVENDKQIADIKHGMEQAVQLLVPCLAEAKIGPNWGEVI